MWYKWNSLNGTKDIAEVEYIYSSDAYKAYRKLDFKSIKGEPIRIEIKDIPKNKLLFKREYLRGRPHNMDYRINIINYYKRMEKIMPLKRHLQHQQKVPKSVNRNCEESKNLDV